MPTKLDVVKISKSDRERLNPHLSNWKVLSQGLSKNLFSLTDLRKMLAIEAEGKMRVHILERLMSKVSTEIRKNQREQLGIEAKKESTIEKKICNYTQSLGFETPKFTSPGTSCVPDRMFIGPNGIVFFVEFKRAGEKPSLGQKRKFEKWGEWGHDVLIIDSFVGGRIIIDEYIELRGGV
ncbi:MAG: hypothetical protein ACE5EE_10495 [Fidelibacterota bacterium]